MIKKYTPRTVALLILLLSFLTAISYFIVRIMFTPESTCDPNALCFDGIERGFYLVESLWIFASINVLSVIFSGIAIARKQRYSRMLFFAILTLIVFIVVVSNPIMPYPN
jgi:hypothetical protein